MSSQRSKITQAIAVHKMWADTLRTAIKSERIGGIKIEKIRRDDQCELGTWLAQDHTKGNLYSAKDFDEAIRLHQNFHQCAANILELVQAGNIESANDMMRDGGQFAECSSALIRSLKCIGKTDSSGIDCYIDNDITKNNNRMIADATPLIVDIYTDDPLTISNTLANLILSKFTKGDVELITALLYKSNPTAVINEMKRIILKLE